MDLAAPQTLESALSAYQLLFGGNIKSLLERTITSADIDALRREKHRLLCVLAGVPESEPDPIRFVCAQEGWHRADWRIEAGTARCPHCTTTSVKALGFWSVAEVLESLPLFQEVIRRATQREE